MIEQKDYKETAGYKNRWRGMIFIGISLIVISIDNTILNVALPSISRTLGASASELQWIVTAYVLMFASLLLTMGALGDRFGRKRMLQIGLVLFGIGSAAAGLSTSTNMLIAARAFLGFGGAIIMPSTLSIITATFPRDEQPRAIAMWAAIFGLGIGIGPVLGGWLIELYDWNSVFFINLPVVLVAIVGGSTYLMESRDESAPRIDIPGILLSIPGLFLLVYAIIEAGNQGWTAPEVLQTFAISAILLTAFALWESRAKEPMLPLYFFKNMSFTAANLAMVLVMFAMFGSIFFMSQYLQSVIGYSAFEAGVRMLPLALTMVVASIASSRVAASIGTKYTVALGIFIAGLG
ncbi:MAG: MFS transporter, partial [Chloroflexi bacterium]|nr:MFS transporter [Chloroflexota bacterium]